MMDKILNRLNIKNGSVAAQSLTSQSYLYRLGYVWLNVLLLEDKRNTSLNPLKWSALDVVWIIYFAALSSVLLITTATLGWVKAWSMKDVTPLTFSWCDQGSSESSTSYNHTHVWYFNNGKINK